MSEAPSQGFYSEPPSDAGFADMNSVSSALPSIQPLWHPNAQITSQDEGFEEVSSDVSRAQAELVNHKISNVSANLLVADANSFIGTALFTKRCRLSDEETGHEKRRVIGQSDYIKIGEFVVIGPNLVIDQNQQRYQIVILTKDELQIYTILKDRIKFAIATRVKNAETLSECLFHPGAQLIEFDGMHIYMQLEHWGTLHNHLIKYGNINEEQCRFLFRQMVELVAFLHELGFVLRDISLRRWIFADEDKTKLVLGTFVDMQPLDNINNDIIGERYGCPANMSPEMVTRNIDSWPGRAADMWSLGINLYVMATRRFPFYDGTAQGLFRKIRHGNYLFPELPRFPALTVRVREIIQDLLQVQPNGRSTAKQLLARSWFQPQHGCIEMEAE